MLPKLKSIHNNQKGFTLIELLVAIAITGLIIGVIGMSIFMIFNISARSDNHMLAVRQVQNAGYWISHDAQMAQQPPVIVNDGGQLESIFLTWEGWDNTWHEVTYTLEDTELKRSYWNDTGEISEILVAEYIDTDNTNCEFTDTDGDDSNDTLFLTVTATVSGRHEATETRVYEVIPRPDQ